MTNVPDFHAMSDAEFEAHWDKRALDAVSHADLTGDDSQVEAVKEAYGDALFERHVATDLAIDMANDIARDITAGFALASIEESTPTETPEQNGEPNVAMRIESSRPTLNEIGNLIAEANGLLLKANAQTSSALDELVGPQPASTGTGIPDLPNDHLLVEMRNAVLRLTERIRETQANADRINSIIRGDGPGEASAGPKQSARLVAA